MNISVALCTFNGGQYIEAQVKSIFLQTLPPAEIVICDDRSSDTTIEIIEKLSVDAPCVIRLYRNEVNLGSTKNFEQAISLCRGDIIFLSDQDDIWLPGKIEKTMSFFRQQPQFDVVFTNGLVITDEQEVVGTLWDSIGFTPADRGLWVAGDAFNCLMLYGNRATGATMAMKKSFISEVVPFERFHFWIHDGIIALKSALQHKIAFIEEPLILYRQHSAQQIGVKGKKEQPLLSLRNKIRNIKWINRDYLLPLNYEDYTGIKALSQHYNIKAAQQQMLNMRLAHLSKRMAAVRKNFLLRPFIVLPEVFNGNYKRFYRDKAWILVVKDLFGV